MQHQRQQLSRRLNTALAAPVALLVLLGVVLARQILLLSDDAAWVDHTDQVISTAHQTKREIIDQESAVRGYLLTENAEFLGPYQRAEPLQGFAKLHQLTADNPAQQERFEDARRKYEGWFLGISQAMQARDWPAMRSLEQMTIRKQRMDALRDAMQLALEKEEGLRQARQKATVESTARTKVLFVVLFAVSAAVLAFFSRFQLKSIAQTFTLALEAEKKAREETALEAWIREGQAKVGEVLPGAQSAEELASATLRALAEHLGADVGAFFTKSGAAWVRRAGYGLDAQSSGGARFMEGEGIVGRAASAGGLLHLKDVPPEFLKVRSGTGEMKPVEIVVLAADGGDDDSTNAVLELGFLREVPEASLELLRRMGSSIGLAVRSSEYKDQLKDLLEEAHRQAEELQTQQEELRVANEELETTQKQLQLQQEELEQTNDSLVEQAKTLERKNLLLAEKQLELAERARDIERTSQFKSEFLSNMSHELRTPLNSSLILAKVLSDNKDGNLSPEQVRFAETIYSAGNDLLVLINDILDLAKIESGKMEVHVSSVSLEHTGRTLTRLFEPVAAQKQLKFRVHIDPLAPANIDTDAQRLEQILKNLVSNALKFTDRGEVSVHMRAQQGRLLFSVHDTGIGIAAEQQDMIFEAFRQADGMSNRRHGGTGLGLSISRDLARLLGGEVSVDSVVGKGSVFTLALPVEGRASEPAPPAQRPEPRLPEPAPTPAIPGNEAPATSSLELSAEDAKRVVVIVEDDDTFASIVADTAREAKFYPLIANSGLLGFQLAKRHLPVGVLLDIGLPDHTGLTVLDRLKRDPATRHIPVHIISGVDHMQAALSMGADRYMLKPVPRQQLLEAFGQLESRASQRMRNVLVVEDDSALRDSISALLERDDVQITPAGSAETALTLLAEQNFDCVITDLSLPGQSGYELLEAMATMAPFSVPPIIVYTGRALSMQEEQRLRKYSASIIVKGARSPERLLDEVTLFLHQVESELPADKQQLLKKARHREAIFEGRRVLIVEDDVRNVFSLSSVLEPKGAILTIARNGKEALSALAADPQLELVLMDVMMPEMDGIEATREIRKNPAWARLPIIALTAKAMRDDQERCLQAGANDYLAKPLDVEMLLSLMRVWMPKT